MNNQNSDDRMARFEEAMLRLENNQRIANEDIHEIKQAVKGDSNIGLNGLVKDMRDMKMWKSQIDLRVASITGSVLVVGFLIKYILHL